MTAEMWKELFEGEGIPTRILPEGLVMAEGVSYQVLVPELKKHIVEEILRKL
ncbi:MAG: hypothetical protein JRI61_06310 [Deltaproteobacteria bacterium]|nr:hypothetical protein [Deltaproteobacteria bacterium]